MDEQINISDDSNTLLMFSGGLDSVGALWNLLKNKHNRLHLHHLHLINKENRAKAEDLAVKNILKYISNIRHVNYSESYHTYPEYSYIETKNDVIVINQNFMLDSDLYNFIAGTICINLPNIKNVAVGRTKSDVGIEERAIRGTSILKLLAPNVEKIYPVGDMTKIEIYNMLPLELRNMAWSCRTPIYIDDLIKECGSCKTCLELHNIKYGI